MKKIISFSLYGWSPKYYVGAYCNAELAKTIYPDWICRFYCSEELDPKIIEKLRSYDNCEVVIMPENLPYSNMMWRFLPIDDNDVEVMICRDADSRLSYREKTCVDLFLSSDCLLHSIQDDQQHDNIMGGMWGMKKNDRVVMSKLFDEWHGGKGYCSDQFFVRELVKPIFSDSYMVHCSHFQRNFPVEPNVNGFFVGQIFFEDNYNKPYDYIFY